jgi:hypothetical protein
MEHSLDVSEEEMDHMPLPAGYSLVQSAQRGKFYRVLEGPEHGLEMDDHPLLDQAITMAESLGLPEGWEQISHFNPNALQGDDVQEIFYRNQYSMNTCWDHPLTRQCLSDLYGSMGMSQASMSVLTPGGIIGIPSGKAPTITEHNVTPEDMWRKAHKFDFSQAWSKYKDGSDGTEAPKDSEQQEEQPREEEGKEGGNEMNRGDAGSQSVCKDQNGGEAETYVRSMPVTAEYSTTPNVQGQPGSPCVPDGSSGAFDLSSIDDWDGLARALQATDLETARQVDQDQEQGVEPTSSRNTPSSVRNRQGPTGRPVDVAATVAEEDTAPTGPLHDATDWHNFHHLVAHDFHNALSREEELLQHLNEVAVSCYAGTPQGTAALERDAGTVAARLRDLLVHIKIAMNAHNGLECVPFSTEPNVGPNAMSKAHRQDMEARASELCSIIKGNLDLLFTSLESWRDIHRKETPSFIAFLYLHRLLHPYTADESDTTKVLLRAVTFGLDQILGLPDVMPDVDPMVLASRALFIVDPGMAFAWNPVTQALPTAPAAPGDTALTHVLKAYALRAEVAAFFRHAWRASIPQLAGLVRRAQAGKEMVLSDLQRLVRRLLDDVFRDDTLLHLPTPATAVCRMLNKVAGREGLDTYLIHFLILPNLLKVLVGDVNSLENEGLLDSDSVDSIMLKYFDLDVWWPSSEEAVLYPQRPNPAWLSFLGSDATPFKYNNPVANLVWLTWRMITGATLIDDEHLTKLTAQDFFGGGPFHGLVAHSGTVRNQIYRLRRSLDEGRAKLLALPLDDAASVELDLDAEEAASDLESHGVVSALVRRRLTDMLPRAPLFVNSTIMLRSELLSICSDLAECLDSKGVTTADPFFRSMMEFLVLADDVGAAAVEEVMVIPIQATGGSVAAQAGDGETTLTASGDSLYGDSSHGMDVYSDHDAAGLGPVDLHSAWSAYDHPGAVSTKHGRRALFASMHLGLKHSESLRHATEYLARRRGGMKAIGVLGSVVLADGVHDGEDGDHWVAYPSVPLRDADDDYSGSGVGATGGVSLSSSTVPSKALRPFERLTSSWVGKIRPRHWDRALLRKEELDEGAKRQGTAFFETYRSDMNQPGAPKSMAMTPNWPHEEKARAVNSDNERPALYTTAEVSPEKHRFCRSNRSWNHRLTAPDDPLQLRDLANLYQASFRSYVPLPERGPGKNAWGNTEIADRIPFKNFTLRRDGGGGTDDDQSTTSGGGRGAQESLPFKLSPVKARPFPEHLLKVNEDKKRMSYSASVHVSQQAATDEHARDQHNKQNATMPGQTMQQVPPRVPFAVSSSPDYSSPVRRATSLFPGGSKHTASSGAKLKVSQKDILSSRRGSRVLSMSSATPGSSMRRSVAAGADAGMTSPPSQLFRSVVENEEEENQKEQELEENQKEQEQEENQKEQEQESTYTPAVEVAAKASEEECIPAQECPITPSTYALTPSVNKEGHEESWKKEAGREESWKQATDYYTTHADVDDGVVLPLQSLCGVEQEQVRAGNPRAHYYSGGENRDRDRDRDHNWSSPPIDYANSDDDQPSPSTFGEKGLQSPPTLDRKSEFGEFARLERKFINGFEAIKHDRSGKGVAKTVFYDVASCELRWKHAPGVPMHEVKDILDGINEDRRVVGVVDKNVSVTVVAKNRMDLVLTFPNLNCKEDFIKALAFKVHTSQNTFI